MKSFEGKDKLPFSAKEINSMVSYFKIQPIEINIGLHMNYWRSMILATYHLKILNFYVLLKFYTNNELLRDTWGCIIQGKKSSMIYFVNLLTEI